MTTPPALYRYLRFKPTAAGAVTWVSPSLQSIDAFTGGILSGENTQGLGQVLNLTINIPAWCGKWVLTMNDFKDGVVGAKSKNIANLRGKIPDWIRLPAAVTVPFGSFEQVRGVAVLSKLSRCHNLCRHTQACCCLQKAVKA